MHDEGGAPELQPGEAAALLEWHWQRPAWARRPGWAPTYVH